MHTRHTEEDRGSSGTPRSALRHRPIGDMYVIPLSDGSTMHVTERELEELPETYQTAARLITPHVAAPGLRRQANARRHGEDEETVDDTPPAAIDALARQPRRRLRFHGLFWLGLALLTMLVGWVALTSVSTWWTNQTNQWTYGYPRTYQVDANVGHGTTANPMSHFIAENFDKHLLVIELPGDDPAHARIYIGPMLIGEGQELTPVTLSFEDVNGDGKPDLVLHVGDSKFIFLNTGSSFKPAPNQ
jgi:hypothetical protein